MKEKTKLTIKHFLKLKAKELMWPFFVTVGLIIPSLVANKFFGLKLGCIYGTLKSVCGKGDLTWIIDAALFSIAFWFVVSIGLIAVLFIHTWISENWKKANRLAEQDLKPKNKRRKRK